MKKIAIAAMVVAVMGMVCGCKKSTIYQEQHEIKEGVWLRFEPERYVVPIDNTEQYYHVEVVVAVDTNIFTQESLPLIVNIYSEDGERRFFRSVMEMKKDGRWRQAAISHEQLAVGNIMIKQRIKTYFSFNKSGKYTFEIGQGTHRYDLRGIESVGLQIERAPLEMPK